MITKEEIALRLTIATMDRLTIPANGDAFLSVIYNTYNNIYDNIICL